MKQDPKMDKMQIEMQPGKISNTGFLGADRRKLIDILMEDEQAVANLGLTHERIAQAMEKLMIEGRKAYGNPVKANEFLEVTVEGSKGGIPCPFGHQGMYLKENVYVLNTKTGKTMYWTALNVHMIREHGFYEGKGSPFRVEPKDVISVLELNK